MAVLVATDFFTVEVLTLTGLITYYVLFFIHLESRRVCLAGVTRHPNQEWMEQMTRNVTMEDSGFLINRRYLLHDRDSKYCPSFRQVIEAGSVKTLALPPRSPNLKDYASHCTSWVRCDTTSLARRLCDSFTPWAFRGGLSPGCSYRQSFLSLQA